MVERVLDGVFDDLLRRRGSEAILGLALEFRLANEDRQHAAGADHDVFARDGAGAFFLTGAGSVILEAAQQRGAQAGFVRAAVMGRDRVAIRLQEAVGVGGPGDRPFDGAMASGLADSAGEDIGMHQRGAFQTCREIILQAIGKVEDGIFRNVGAGEQLFSAVPADFDAAI